MPKIYFINLYRGETNDQAIMFNQWFLSEKDANSAKTEGRIKILMVRVEAVA
jgi:hypothetical protein